MTYAHPIYKLTLNGKEMTEEAVLRIVDISLTDNRGLEADQLDVRLSDHDGKLAIPKKGDEVRFYLGWSDTGLLDKGSYIIDEIEHSGAPDVLTIRARSADLREGFKAKAEVSWHGKTLGEIISTIAKKYQLEPIVDGVLSGKPIQHIDQANESDANLLSRLGQQYDAVATIKAGRLLFMPVGQSKSGSGIALPHITLHRTDGDQHRFLQADRDKFTGVRAYYHSTEKAKKLEAIAGAKEHLKDLRHLYNTEQSAKEAAEAEWKRVQRGTATLSFTLAKGRPDLIPELTYTLTGIKPEIEAITWLGSHVRHSLTDQSYTTSLELESHIEDELES